MKKTLTAGMLGSLILVAGCASGSETWEPTAQAGITSETAPITLTLLMDVDSSSDGIRAVADAIEARYNIITEIEMRPGGTEGDNIVRTRLATGVMSDLVFYNSGALFLALGPENFFVDISDQPAMNYIDEGFRLATSVGEASFGIPGQYGMGGGWLYNRRVYETLGLSVPNTWQELMHNLQVIYEAGLTPVVKSFADTWTAQLVVLADYYNVYMEEPDFTHRFTHNLTTSSESPAMLRSFERLGELGASGFVNSDIMATTFDEALYRLATGQAAHYPMLSFALPQITALFPQYIGDIGMFGQPGDGQHPRGLTVWTPAGIYLNAASPYREAQLQWLNFFASPEGGQIFVDNQTPDGPSAIMGVTMPEGLMQAVLDMQAYIDAGRTAPALEFLTPLKGPSLEQILVEVGMGIVTPLQGAQHYDMDVVMQAMQLGLEGW